MSAFSSSKEIRNWLIPLKRKREVIKKILRTKMKTVAAANSPSREKLFQPDLNILLRVVNIVTI